MINEFRMKNRDTFKTSWGARLGFASIELRLKLLRLAEKVSSYDQAVSEILLPVLYNGNTQRIMQILLDCSAMPAIISHTQIHGPSVCDKIFYFGRTWCYYIHRERMNQMGLPNFK